MNGGIDMDLPEVNDVLLQFNKLLLLYNSALKEINTKLEILNDEFKFVHQYNPIEHIKSRIKSGESIKRSKGS